MKLFITRLISLILILSTFCTAFASCNGDENTGVSDSESDNETGGYKQTEPIIDPEGVLTIFANGAYNVKFIRSENASAIEKDAYNKIRELFKKRVSVNPSINTDFVAAGSELYDGPAVIIGETDYKESKSAYNKLNVGEATATLVGNKYVIAFSTQNSLDTLIENLKTNLNKKASKTEIKADSQWNITVKLQYYTSGNDTFDETGLIKSANLPGNLGSQHNSSALRRLRGALCKQP